MPRLVLLACLVAVPTVAAQSPVAEIVLATPGVTFGQPLGVEAAPGQADGRLYVLEKAGRVRTLVPGDAAPTVFLDLRDRTSAAGEGGLLGLAFHPDYAANGRLFVSYTAPVDQPVDGVRVLVSRVSEFSRDPDDPLRADPDSERVLLEVDQPATNHNGGTVDFGTDGFLYFGLGDGGGANDEFKNGQDPTTLLGALLRIDVDDVPDGAEYGIPDDNPFAQTDGPERDEIFAYGFRNPFKFDVSEAGVWVGDVGQNAWEEVDQVVAGGNYGWNEVEGPECFQPGCDLDAFEAPVFSYPHPVGQSITGGFVAGGADVALSGAYLFGDFVSGRLWALDPGADEATLLAETFPRPNGPGPIQISSIDLAPDGLDILVTDFGGSIYRVVRSATAVEGGPEARGLALAGPNPFRERTALRLAAPGPVRVVLTDVRGREVAVLWDGPAPARPVSVDGTGLAPGVYAVVATDARGSETLRLVKAR
ncbi:PQQ-dependent sugar dehydrogenase [Rubrivirga sp.]|uniref:PQQ-dependent sugar dehydrogenase n=1 Tax=Rubrivirga sp. TaxID=1885344 RepID=UPI003B5188D8